MEKINGKDLLIQEMKEDIERLKQENTTLREERNHLQHCLDEIRKSFSYRLGLACTYLPRKIKRIGKC